MSKTIFCDGAGWNKKISRTCVLIEGQEPIVKVYKEKKSNNEMEYASLIQSLYFAEDGDTIITDSQLLVGHLIEGWKVKAQNLKPLFEIAKKALGEKDVKLIWQRRGENLAGIYLEKTK